MTDTRKKGFTLIELVMTMAILVVIAGISVQPLIKLWRLWHYNTSHMEMLWSSKTLMEDLSRHIRMVEDADSVSIATQARLVFTEDINGDGASDTVDYNYDAANRRLSITHKFKEGASYNYRTVTVNNLSSFSFTYVTSDGLAAHVSPNTNIRSVKISLTFNVAGESVSSTSIIKLRNLD